MWLKRWIRPWVLNPIIFPERHSSVSNLPMGVTNYVSQAPQCPEKIQPTFICCFSWRMYFSVMYTRKLGSHFCFPPLLHLISHQIQIIPVMISHSFSLFLSLLFHSYRFCSDLDYNLHPGLLQWSFYVYQLYINFSGIQCILHTRVKILIIYILLYYCICICNYIIIIHT